MVIMIMRMMDFKGIALKSLVDRTRRFQALNNQVGDNLKIYLKKVFVIKQRKFYFIFINYFDYRSNVQVFATVNKYIREG